MKPLRVLSLFDGQSCARLALHNLGIPVARYVASEIDPFAIKVSKSNWSDIEHVGSVVDLHINEGDFDLICAGSPCQGFSFCGKMLNFDDSRSKLFFEYKRLLDEGKPRWHFLENNKMKKEYEDVITNTIGVAPIKINSALVSCANRARIYWMNIPNHGIPADRQIMLKSIIGDYESIYVIPRGFNQKGYHGYKGKCPCITAHGSWKHNFFYVRDGKHIKFTSEQAERIMGLPIGYTSAVSETQRWSCIGNGWNIPTVEYLFQGLKQELE